MRGVLALLAALTGSGAVLIAIGAYVWEYA